MADSVEQTLGRLEGKLDAFLETQKQQHERLNDHGKRIGSLERWQSKIIGAVALVSVVIGWLVKIIS